MGEVQLAHGHLHLHGTQQRAIHIVLARHGRTEQHHDRVAHELVDAALVLEHHFGQPRQAAVERRNHHRRRLRARQSGEPAQVGQQDGDLTWGHRPVIGGRTFRAVALAQDGSHLGEGFFAQRRAGLALDQRLQAAHRIVVEFFVHGAGEVGEFVGIGGITGPLPARIGGAAPDGQPVKTLRAKPQQRARPGSLPPRWRIWERGRPSATPVQPRPLHLSHKREERCACSEPAL
ncbi:hypothetical protein D3C71_1432520 [compost metagenome]